jgi:hypothetical protein
VREPGFALRGAGQCRISGFSEKKLNRKPEGHGVSS